MKDQLYLLKPGFTNADLGLLYCGDSVAVEGMLSFFPALREVVDVHYLDFPRPRAALVEALGEANQSVPVLILAEDREISDAGVTPRFAGKARFIADERLIRRYLSSQFGFPLAG
jgi:hypothetical protein